MTKKHTEASFWARVNISHPDVCWEWTGSINNSGYGTVSWNGTVYVAHRVAAYLFGMVDELYAPKQITSISYVLHKCDNRKCCNPHHFFLGTYTDNLLDCYKKGRRRLMRGAEHKNAKLTSADITHIRSIQHTDIKQQTLADMYGVSQTCISQILRKASYK